MKRALDPGDRGGARREGRFARARFRKFGAGSKHLRFDAT